MTDPLKGLRRSIAEGKVKVLIWPADQECPVEKGQRFKIQSIEIEIETVQRKIVKGRAPEWHATFVRHEPDRVYLLRQAPPVHATHEQDHDLDSSMAERARRDGQYTSSRLTAVQDEPESVGPDWKDSEAAKRELSRQKIRQENQDTDQAISEIRKFKARASQVMVESSRAGRDLTPLLNDIFERLAEEEKLAKGEAA